MSDEKMVTVTVIKKSGHEHRGIRLLPGTRFDVPARKIDWLVANGVIARRKIRARSRKKKS